MKTKKTGTCTECKKEFTYLFYNHPRTVCSDACAKKRQGQKRDEWTKRNPKRIEVYMERRRRRYGFNDMDHVENESESLLIR